MESVDEAWRHAQPDKTRLAAPFTLVLRAGTASDGLDSDVVVDEMTMWHHSPLLKDMAGYTGGRPLALEDVSAAALYAVVQAWYNPAPPTWRAELLPDIFSFAHKYGMERAVDVVLRAITAGPVAKDVLVIMYRRASRCGCESIRRAALVELCAGWSADAMVKALGTEPSLLEDAHLVVEHATSTFYSTMRMLRVIADQKVDTTKLNWEPICSFLVQWIVTHKWSPQWYQQMGEGLDFKVSTREGETMLARHSFHLAVTPLNYAALRKMKAKLASLKRARTGL